MYKLTKEDWDNILQALSVYRHNPSFKDTYERVRSCVEAVKSGE